MTYELKKLFFSRPIIIMFFCLIAANAAAFYGKCTADINRYTLSDIMQKYENVDILENEIAVLDEKADEWWINFTDPDPGFELVTEDIYSELAVDRYVFERANEVGSYDTFLLEKISEIKARLRTGFAGDPDDYSYKAQENVLSRYDALVGLKPEIGFFDHISTFADWSITDLILLIFVLTAGILLFSEEKRSGIMLLLRPTANGRGILFAKKVLALSAFTLAVFMILYASDIIVLYGLFGAEGLPAPIQSVPGFMSCSIPFTVIGFLIFHLLGKLIWTAAIASLTVLICTIISNPAGVGAVSAVLFAGSYFPGLSNNLWIRSLSLIRLSDPAGRLRQCLMLNLLGYPITENAAFFLISGLIILISVFSGGMVFAHKDTAAKALSWSFSLPKGRYTNLLRHEAFKLLISQKALLLLLAFTAIQIGICSRTYTYISSYEYRFQEYSAVLSGFPSDEKDSYIRSEQERFEELHSQIDFYRSIAEDPALAGILTSELEAQLQDEKPFTDAVEIYTSIRPGNEYVHPTGYEKLFNPDGKKRDLLSLLIMQLFMVLSLSGIFVIEKETGVVVLQTCLHAKAAVRGRKLLLAFLSACAAVTVAFLPRILLITDKFGLPLFSAPAGSLSIFSELPQAVKIWHVFVLYWVIRLFIAAADALIILRISKKTEFLSATVLINSAILVLPVGAAWLLM